MPYGKCCVNIDVGNIDFAHKEHLRDNNDRYQNIVIIDKNIKGLLLSKGLGIMDLKKKFKRKENNRDILC